MGATVYCIRYSDGSWGRVMTRGLDGVVKALDRLCSWEREHLRAVGVDVWFERTLPSWE